MSETSEETPTPPDGQTSHLDLGLGAVALFGLSSLGYTWWALIGNVAVSILFTLCGCLVTGLVSLARQPPREFRLPLIPTACFCGALLSEWDLLRLQGHLPAPVLLLLVGLCQVGIVGALVYTGCQLWRVPYAKSIRLTIWAVIPTLTITIFHYAARQWFDLGGYLSALVREASITACLGYIQFLYSRGLYTPSEGNNHTVLKISPEVREIQSKRLRLGRWILGSSAANVALVSVLALGHLIPSWISPLSLTTYWIPIILSIIRSRHKRPLETLDLAQIHLAPEPARRFVNRYRLREKGYWAQTLGVRTTHFMIDYDPESQISGGLPKTIQRVRSEEILRCLSEIISSRSLHLSSVGSRIYGAIDSEVSPRPCLDALKLFCCLYLDTNPLIEKRMRQLYELLPIIDRPALDHFRSNLSTQTGNSGQWIFYLDFIWIDQNIIHSPDHLRYFVQLDSLTPRVAEAILTSMRRNQNFGNILWLSLEGRDRLLQEAPLLHSIIDACPLIIEGSGVEVLLFTIKFENLVPKLQKFFDLDHERQRLLAFLPSHESLKFANLMRDRLHNGKNPEEILAVVESVLNFPWNGFQEKDSALGLLVEAYNCLQSKNDHHATKVSNHIIAAIQYIGFPGQLLYSALQKKRELRVMTRLLQISTTTNHHQFEEAWLLISTLQLSTYAVEDIERLRDFLRTLHKSPKKLIGRGLVQVKAIDALCNVARAMGVQSCSHLSEIASNYSEWFLKEKVTGEVWCTLLDGLQFIETCLEIPIELAPEIEIQINDAIESDVSMQADRFYPLVQSRWGRWKNKKQNKSPSRSRLVS